MTDSTTFVTTFLDNLLSSGSKVLSYYEQSSQIGLNALKQAVTGQIEVGAALSDLGTSQFSNLGGISSPQDFLQRQKEAAGTLGSTLQNHFEQVRILALETQQAYVGLTRDTVTDIGKSFSPAAA